MKPTRFHLFVGAQCFAPDTAHPGTDHRKINFFIIPNCGITTSHTIFISNPLKRFIDIIIKKKAIMTVSLTITIIYDNNPHNPKLDDAWGFSALVQHHGKQVLFDTGGDGQILLANMQQLQINPQEINAVILSHYHGDHIKGLQDILALESKPTVYIPPSFPDRFRRKVSKLTTTIDVTTGQSITETMFTSGEINSSIPEQALAVKTVKGLVIITGCAHPGIVRIVETIRSLLNGPVYLVVGGFHLGRLSRRKISAILEDFRRLGVIKVAPCHCTGNRASAMFADEFKEDFIKIGVGSVIKIKS